MSSAPISPALLLHKAAGVVGNSRPRSGLTRRGFLRAGAIAGFGMGLNVVSGLAKAFPAACANAEAGAIGNASDRIMVGLDLGTSTIRVAVAERSPEKITKILGIGQAPSRGFCEWGIFDFEAARECVQEALVDAEVKSDVMISSICLAVGRPPYDLFYNDWRSDRLTQHEQVCYADRGNRLIQRIPSSLRAFRSTSYVLPGDGTAICNAIQCVNDLGVNVRNLALAPVASAEAVLNTDEKELGALVIDMDEGKASHAVYAHGLLKHSGCLLLREGKTSNLRLIECDEIGTFNHSRLFEAIDLLKTHLTTKGAQLDQLGAGIHVTGAYSSICGIDSVAQEVFGHPAQVARVKDISSEATGDIQRSEYSCAIGLTRFGFRELDLPTSSAFNRDSSAGWKEPAIHP
jgi:cell division protein FtsA